MGHAVVTCARCRNRLTGADFEKGGVVEVGGTFHCGACAPEAQAALPKPEPER